MPDPSDLTLTGPPNPPSSLPTGEPLETVCQPDDGSDRTERIEPGPLPEIPGYLVESELGRGGMGVVYRAREAALNRTVALKMVLAGASARAEDLIRFLAEAETAAHLQHQGIVQIFGSGRVGGLPFFAMEYVAGGSLADCLARPAGGSADRAGPKADRPAGSSTDRAGQGTGGALQPTEAARVALQLAEAVGYAHAAGVIHRDLKPGNILLTPDGTPKITDFGLARRLEAGDGLTRTGTVLGTPAYMPPEQARGDLREVGPIGDVYSLGAILYEMLTGRPPFRSDSPVNTLSLVLHEPPPKPRSQNAAIPRDLETIALKCLEKDPGRRYASAAALADDLRRFLEGRPIRARQITPAERLWRWAKRNPAVATLLVAVFASLAAGAVISAAFAVRAAANADRADANAHELEKKVREVEDARGAAVKEATEATTARRDLALTLADSYTTLGFVAGERNDPAAAALWFARAVRQSQGDPEREFHNRVRYRNWSAEAFAPVSAFETGPVVTDLSLHPGGRYLAARASGPVEIWEVGRAARWTPPRGFERLYACDWDATGGRVVLGTVDGRVGVFEFPSGKLVRERKWDGSVAVARFSPDGRAVAVGGFVVRVWNLDDDRFVTPSLDHPGSVYSAEFAPDGGRLATGSNDGKARVFGLTGQPTATPELTADHSPYQSTQARVPRFADAGRVLVVSPSNGLVRGIDLATGKPRFEHRQEKGYFSFAVSPDGQTLWAGQGENGRGIDVFDAAYSTRRSFTLPHTNSVFSVACTPDGRTVVTGSADRTVCVWDAETGRRRFPTLAHAASVRAVACTPDGQTVATTQENGLVRVWRVPRPPTRTIATGADYAVTRFAGGGRYVLPAGGTYRTATIARLQLYDPATGAPAAPAVAPGGIVLDADVSPDGRLLVTVSARSTKIDEKTASLPPSVVRFWEVESGRPVGKPIETPSEPRAVRFRPDGGEVAVLCAGGQVVILDPGGPRVKRTAPPQAAFSDNQYVNNGRLEYTPDGRRVLVFGPSSWPVAVYAPESGTASPIRGLDTGVVYDTRASRDGLVWAVSSQKSATRFLSPTGGEDPAVPLPHPDWTFSARFDRAGHRLVTGCRDGAARLWDWRAGKLLATYRHADEVPCAEFLPDERFLVTASYDGTVRVWRTAAGEPVSPAIPVGGKVLSLDVTPDGRYAVASGFSKHAVVADLAALTTPAGWDADELDLRAELASSQKITPSGGLAFLTSEEWMARWKELRRRNP